MTRPVDVVVPVYGQADLSLACLATVLEARAANKTAYRVVIVDDGSPDASLRMALETMRGDNVTVITHEENRGFVAAANTGMGYSDNDVILLNSDAEVYGDFADRLAHAAYRDNRTATATPFTNFGSIAAYPEPSRPNALPFGWSAADLDRLASRVNAGMTIAAPAGVGFCMYLRRACLDAVGLFDPAFGRGYGEEVDLCLRASSRGWRHVLAPNVFVWHRGGASFGEERLQRLAESREILRARHPAFRRIMRSFTVRDPGRVARHRLTAARMAEDPRPVILRLSHAESGGVHHHITDLSALCEPWAESLELRPGPRGRLVLRSPLTPAGFDLRTGRAPDLGELAHVLRSLGVARLHVHHQLGHGGSTADLIRALNVPIDVTLHDYFFLAPQAHLVDRAGAFAGEPDDRSEAERALLANSQTSAPGRCLSEWRARWNWLFERSARVIAQSSDCARRYARYFPRPIELAQPPLTPPVDTPVEPRLLDGGPLRVLAVGALSREKGADLLEGAARLARLHDWPLEFHLAGYAYRNLDPAVRVHGRYRRPELDSVISSIGPHLAWYPIQWPETWLQTLTPALTLGLPVLVADIGAAYERVAGRPWTWTMPWDSSPSEVCALLLDIREAIRTKSPPDPPGLRYPCDPVRTDFYPSDYLAPVLAGSGPGLPISAEDLATVERLTLPPASRSSHLLRMSAVGGGRWLLRSRLGGVIRRLPPHRLASLARAVRWGSVLDDNPGGKP